MIKIGIECESIEGKEPMWGVGRMIVKLLEEVARRPELEKSHRFVLYFKDHIPDLPFLDAPIFEKKKIPVPFFKNRLFPIYYFAILPMKLWFEGLDVMFWPNYMLPIIAFNRSVVMLAEDIYYEAHEGKLPFRYRLAYGLFGWWTAKFSTQIMTISETSKKNIGRLYKIDPKRITVNHLGIDFSNGSPENTRHDKYILCVGQAFPRRHLRETILAFEKLIKLILEHSDILKNVGMSELQLIAIGPDKYETPVVKKLVAQTNKNLGREAVIHKDYVKDSELVELYAGASALVYVSDREAFGLPPMEALSFGVPPVIADNELGHELFEDYAFYADRNDVDGITEGMRKALTQTDKISKINNSGPEFARKYSWKNFTDKFLENVQNINPALENKGE